MNAGARRFGVTLLVLAGAVAIPMLLLRPVWRSPVSAGEDDLIYYYPLRVMAAEADPLGDLSAYNAREACGVPLQADPQSASLHPTTGLFRTLPAGIAYRASVFLAFALAGLGAWFYLRELGLCRQAAALGAAAFMLCGFMVGHRVHLSVILAGAMLPWGTWCVERLRGRDGWAWHVVPWTTLTVYMAISAGHWPTFLHLCLAWGAYALWRGRPRVRSVTLLAAGAAVAMAMAWPQVAVTRELMASVTRQRIGYATAGENSFFPLSAVLALFPFLQGTRTTNLYPQPWWGSWHLCEMLGYVGLLTLGIAAGTAWRMFRPSRVRRLLNAQADAPGTEETENADPASEPWRLHRLVRGWVWLILAAGVFMLGYYLPTYRLVHMLPVLGVVRCPARMVLLVDLGLATLAAVGVHVAVSSRSGPLGDHVRGAIRRAVVGVLPWVMLGTLVAMGVFAAVCLWQGVWVERIDGLPFAGGTRAMFRAVLADNPAVWVPLMTLIASAGAVLWWLRSPRRRGWVLTAVLLADLAMVAGFVDAPAASEAIQPPDTSPAARWLGERYPDRDTYRVWGASDSYHARAAELLSPKTAHAMGFSTINSYGPFQSPHHAHLLGFRIYGTNDDWARLIRTNHLLSCYGVRFIMAADPEVREVIESVRMPAGGLAAATDGLGPELLAGAGDSWTTFGGAKVLADETADGGSGLSCRLEAMALWRPAGLHGEGVALEPGQTVRISLDARAPEGGAANFLQAEVGIPQADGSTRWEKLIVHAEQMGENWRHFQTHFRVPGRADDGVSLSEPVIGRFQILTMSERPIEARNVSVRAAPPPDLVVLDGWAADDRPLPGEPVYRRLTVLDAIDADDPPVAIYANRLWSPELPPTVPPTDDAIERLKWRPGEIGDIHIAGRPDLAIPPVSGAPWPAWVSWVVLAGTLTVGGALTWRAGRGEREPDVS